jgi:membrane protein implicated in regulation of membrane protease activity
MSDELVVFTAFIALAQIVVGLVLVLAGFSSAVQIIGAVVVALGVLTGVWPPLQARRARSRRSDPDGPTVPPHPPVA